MRRPLKALFLAVLTTTAVAACGDDDANSDVRASGSDSAGEAARTKAPPPAAATKSEPAGTKIKVRPSDYGEVIWDSKRQAIYLFTKEKGSKSRCYGACAEAWPPVLTKGKPVAGTGVDKELLGTTKRDDGKRQITYGGHPLYYYDEPPGEIRCQNVNEFGGLWLVVKPNGKPVR